jgi:putative DNA primase/helicase
MKAPRVTPEDLITAGIDPAGLRSEPIGSRNGEPAAEDDTTRGTDVGLARQLCQIARHLARYSEQEQRWYVYDTRRWKRGTANLVTPFVHQLARSMYQRAATAPTPGGRGALAKQAARLETDRVIRSVLNQARALPEFQIDSLLFDRDPDLLNVLNGTIDLRTGELRPHNPADLISKLARVEYHPDATSPLWQETVELATARWSGDTVAYDPEMASFLQRRAGYALTGHNSEKVFFIDYGATGAGKTSVNVPLSKMLGPDYSKSLRPDALLAQREPDKIPHEIAALRGMRFVICSEVPGLKRFNEGLLKDLTGGDPISACFKYGDEFTFDPQLTLVMYSNHRPEFSGRDDAVWSRAQSVPFEFDFRKYPGVDTTVRERLQEPEHQQAILAWAVKGCLDWRQNGMRTPDRVKKDTEAHRQDVATVGRFLAERCQIGTFEPDEAATSQALHRAYTKWDRMQPAPEKLQMAAFTLELARLGHECKASMSAKGWNKALRYASIRLVPDDDGPPF